MKGTGRVVSVLAEASPSPFSLSQNMSQICDAPMVGLL
jgi:hypothetical protein